MYASWIPVGRKVEKLYRNIQIQQFWGIVSVEFYIYFMEGMTGIEPASSVWKTEALPLSYIPIYMRKSDKGSVFDTLFNEVTLIYASCIYYCITLR